MGRGSKRKYSGQPSSDGISSARGSSCFILGTVRGKETLAAKKFVEKLEATCEIIVDPSSKRHKTSVRGRIAAETEALANRAPKFALHPVGRLASVVVVRCVNPADDIRNWMKRVVEHNLRDTDYVTNVAPYEFVFKVDVDDVNSFTHNMERAIQPYLISKSETPRINDEREGRTFAIRLKRLAAATSGSGDAKVERALILQSIAGCVDPKHHPVDLRDPDVVVSAALVHNTLGIFVEVVNRSTEEES